MKNLKSNQQETIMYLSRMLVQHDNIRNIENRSLVLTIDVRNLADTRRVQNAVFQKVHKALYGHPSSPDKFNFSLMLAGDVEHTRKGYIPEDHLRNPLLPHYHGLMIFSEEDWQIISADLSNWIATFRKVISKIEEVKPPEIDDDGCYINETIWIKKFENKKSNDTKYHSALAVWVAYLIKCDVLANKKSINTYQPTVFPFDRNSCPILATDAERLFNDLYRQQQEFEASRPSNGYRHR